MQSLIDELVQQATETGMIVNGPLAGDDNFWVGCTPLFADSYGSVSVFYFNFQLQKLFVWLGNSMF